MNPERCSIQNLCCSVGQVSADLSSILQRITPISFVPQPVLLGNTLGLTGPNMGVLSVQSALEAYDIYADTGYIRDLVLDSVVIDGVTGPFFTGPTGPSGGGGGSTGPTGPSGGGGGGLTDQDITPTYAAPYSITSADAGKGLIVTTPSGTSGVVFGDTSTAPIGTIIGLFTPVVRTAIPSPSGIDPFFNPSSANVPSGNIYAIVAQPDGKILVGGAVTSSSASTQRFVRLNTDGTSDPAFTRPAITAAAQQGVNAIALRADGTILIGGVFTLVNATTRNKIALLNTDGTLDLTFDPNCTSTTASTGVNAIVLQADGKILIGGAITAVGGTARNYIARLNTDGTLDLTFDPNADNTISAIALQADGKIIIGGSFTTIGGTARNRIARLNTDGTLDLTFDPNADNAISAIALQADGKIIIGGSFTTIGGTARNRIARLNTDGTLDLTFDPNANNTISAIALQADGKIIIGGTFTTIGGTARNRIVRLNTDGSVDTDFNPNAGSNVFTIALQTDGNILCGGQFTTIGYTSRNRIARLNQVYISNTLKTLFDNDGLLVQYSNIVMKKIGADDWVVTSINF